METTVEEISLSTMKLTIKIPLEGVELAKSNALVLMREVRQCLQEEGNYIGHLFTPKNLSPIIIKKKQCLLSKRTVSWSEIFEAVSPIAIQGSPIGNKDSPIENKDSPNAKQYSPNARQDSPNSRQDSPNARQFSPNGKKLSPNLEQLSPIAKLFSSFGMSSKTPKATFDI